MPGAPRLPGLTLRRFAGEADFPSMVAVANASRAADGVQHVSSVGEMERSYGMPNAFDPNQDVVIAEINGEMVGYARSWSAQEVGGTYLYGQLGFVAPGWRRQGVGQALLAWLERRQREIGSAHPPAADKLFNVFVTQPERGRAAMLEQAGYRPARYFFSMVRPDLAGIADFPLPSGIELRPVLPEHYRAVWETDDEVFASHWGRRRAVDGDYEAWLAGDAPFQPALWQVAWDIEANRIAGQTRPYIDASRNREFGRLRGYTEFIVVREPWRRRGLARALISHSLQALKDAGMTESELEVDSENPSGATGVYEACGFRVEHRNVVYRKPLMDPA
jgi:GNAT superfamily N-acetyltransferase